MWCAWRFKVITSILSVILLLRLSLKEKKTLHFSILENVMLMYSSFFWILNVKLNQSDDKSNLIYKTLCVKMYVQIDIFTYRCILHICFLNVSNLFPFHHSYSLEKHFKEVSAKLLIFSYILTFATWSKPLSLWSLAYDLWINKSPPEHHQYFIIVPCAIIKISLISVKNVSDVYMHFKVNNKISAFCRRTLSCLLWRMGRWSPSSVKTMRMMRKSTNSWTKCE